MSHSEATAWWTDVEHLRERIEERRAAEDAMPESAALQLVKDAPAPAAVATAPRPRRTVQIRGRGSEPPTPRPLVEIERRRPAPRAMDRAAHRPDRVALWAAMLGAVLVLVAVLSAHG